MASLTSLSLDMENPVHTVHSMSKNKQVISLDRLESHSAQDTAIPTLVDIIIKGIHNNRDIEQENTREYFRVRSELPTVDPVVLYGKRVIIPTSLQAEGRKVLHAAHQGT